MMLRRQGDSLAWAESVRGLHLRQGGSRDRLQVNWLWNHAARRYRVPGREQLGEMLIRTPNVLWHQEGRLRGVVLASLMRCPVVDIRQLAALEPKDVRLWARDILPLFAERCASLGLEWLSLHDCPAWLEDVLSLAGFYHVADVVSYALENWAELPVPSPASITSRRATLLDTEDVLRIDAAAFTPYWRINRALAREGLDLAAYKLVAESEGVPVGYLFAERWPSQAYISRVGVLPEWQGRGIGRLLVVEALGRFRLDGVRCAALNTQRDNLRSTQLYADLGFAPTGEVSTYWGRNLTAT